MKGQEIVVGKARGETKFPVVQCLHMTEKWRQSELEGEVFGS